MSKATLYRPASQAKFPTDKLSAEAPIRGRSGPSVLYRTFFDKGPFAFQLDGKIAFGLGFYNQALRKVTWNALKEDIPLDQTQFICRFNLTAARSPGSTGHDAALRTLNMLEDVYQFHVRTAFELLGKQQKKPVSMEMIKLMVQHPVRGSVDEAATYTDGQGEERENLITFEAGVWFDERQSPSDPMVTTTPCTLVESSSGGGWTAVAGSEKTSLFDVWKANCNGIFRISARPTNYFNSNCYSKLKLEAAFIEPRQGSQLSDMDRLDSMNLDNCEADNGAAPVPLDLSGIAGDHR